MRGVVGLTAQRLSLAGESMEDALSLHSRAKFKAQLQQRLQRPPTDGPAGLG